tara:strand:- start:148 stop:690 length:543 start_codon:yes stop_codon:yes gene_type:complete
MIQRVSIVNIADGINRAATQGYHNLNNKMVAVVGGNPSITHHDPREPKGPALIGRQVMEDGEWLYENNRMAGFRTARRFDGSQPVNAHLAFERDMRPTMVGDVQAGGAFKGGFLDDTLAKPNDKDYPEAMGEPLIDIVPSGVALEQVNPFPVRLNISLGKDIRYSKTDDVPKGVALSDAK